MTATKRQTSSPQMEPAAAKIVHGQAFADWPFDVRAMMEVICRNPHFGDNRRRRDRKRYNVTGKVKFLDVNGKDCTAGMYIRDLSGGHVAFIGQFCLQAGAKITMTFPLPSGKEHTSTGTVCRCRQFFNGWFDCVVGFQNPEKAPKRRWFAFGRRKSESTES